MNTEAHMSRNANARRICRSIMDAVTDVIVIVDSQSHQVLDVNKKATEMYGYSRKELLGKQLRDVLSEFPDPSLAPLSGTTTELTFVNRRGETLDFLASYSPIEYWGRKAVLSISRDIRELKRIQGAVAANERKCRCLLQNISEIIALIDSQGQVKWISDQAERILGIPTNEIVGHNVFEFIHPEEGERAHREYATTLREPGEAVPSVLRFRDSAGEWIPFEIIANNQTHEPEIGVVIFTARDLRYRRELEDGIRRANAELDSRVEERTMELARANAALRLENQQRRFTERQLSESVSLLNATLESTADGILVISTEGTIRSFNQKFVDMWRIPQSALATLSDDTLLRSAAPQLEQPDEFLKSTRNLYASPHETSLDTLRLKDGRIFERYSQPQRVSSRITGRVWSFRDVTQELTLQEELRQAQKMEAIGRLAGGVAHDFNNVLMLISGYAAQLLDDPQLSQNGKVLCKHLSDATSRAVSVTRQLLAFSRKNPVTPRVLDLNEVVSDLAKVLPRLLSDRVQLQVGVEKDPLPIFADRSQMELIIVNLALNARDAMPAGGTLSITTRGESLDKEKTTKAEPPRSFGILQVSDTGQGMSADISSRIFEPFFTTKGVGKGTGLGLSTAYGIVEQAGGHITVESEPDEGSTFRVYLPLVKESPVAEDSEIPIERVKGDETILLVEDEEGIREMTRTYLQGLGYKVLEAANGPDALRVSREYRSPIDLLLTDVLMPGMRGDDLAHLLQSERPGILTLFISGYANAHELGSNVTVIEKPFAFPELGSKLREALDKRKYLHQRQAS